MSANSVVNFKLWGQCGVCHEDRFFIRKVEITLPNNKKAQSQSLMCKKCRQAVDKMLKDMKNNV